MHSIINNITGALILVNTGLTIFCLFLLYKSESISGKIDGLNLTIQDSQNRINESTFKLIAKLHTRIEQLEKRLKDEKN